MMTMLLSRLPHNLYFRVVLAMITCIALVLAGSTVVLINQTQAGLSDELLKRGQSQVEVLASAANAYVAEGNSSQLTLIAAATTAQHQVGYIAFYDAEHALLSSAAAPTAPTSVRTSFADLRAQVQSTGSKAFHWSDNYLDIVAPITWIGRRIGFVGIRIDTSDLVQARVQSLRQGAVTAVILICLLSLAIGFLLRNLMILPLRRLSVAAEQIGRGIWTEPVGQHRRDELGQMARSFAQMTTALQSRETQLQEQVAAVQDLNAALDSKVVERTAQLHNLVAEQEHLLAQIHQMSIPVVPVLDGVIVVPLIGSLDSARAGRMIQNVLAGIEEHRANLAVLDITGVPVVDTQVAHALIQVAQSTRLLGTKTVLVGIRPDVAATLVQLGVDLREIQTFVTLQEALRLALNVRTLQSAPPKSFAT